MIYNELINNKMNIKNTPTTSHLFHIFNNVIYENFYGTKENTKTGSNKILNVIDAERELRNSILSIQLEETTSAQAYMNKYTECGKMYIYTNGTPMKYIPTSK